MIQRIAKSPNKNFLLRQLQQNLPLRPLLERHRLAEGKPARDVAAHTAGAAPDNRIHRGGVYPQMVPIATYCHE